MIGESTIEDAARETAGNWQRFDSFIWYGRPAGVNPKEWAIVYTSNRDSGPTDKANAAEIGEALDRFVDDENSDVIPQCHNHCLVGWVEGFAIRVYRDGEITEAFRMYHGLMERLSSYGVLNETRQSELQNEEIESGWENWARHDFEKAIVKRFGVELRDGANLREIWDKALDTGLAYWFEESSGMTIQVDGVVKGIAADDALPLLDTAVSQATETIANLLIDAIEALPNAGSVYAGAGLCANAGGLPDMSDGLNPYDADELFRVLFYFKTQYAEFCPVAEPALSKALCELDRIASIANR